MSEKKMFYVVVNALYRNEEISHPFDSIVAAVDLGIWHQSREEALAELKEGEEILELEVSK